MKYLIVTDFPAPWREKVYECVYEEFGNDFHVLYCNYSEKRRLWTFPLGNYPKTFLKSRTVSQRGKERFISLEIIPFLLKNRPEIVVWFSFQPTVVLSLLVSKLLGSKLPVLSDTWLERDRNISTIQKFGRKIAYNYCADAFIGVSRQTLNMYRFYNENINDKSLFLSALCADNEYFSKKLEGKHIERKYDIMFSGRVVDAKNPLFFAEVARKIKEKNGSCSVLIIGEGDERLRKSMFRTLEEAGVEFDFSGFIEHKRLPEFYARAKILLFPTTGDCWGVVINEAMVSGLPVITTDMTAAAGELVLDGKNGYVLPLDSDLWAEKTSMLLKIDEKWHAFSKCARETVSAFTFEKAAQGIIAAIEYLNRK
jgi:glycosyltransferase involved in cell wall biosynthesis